MRRWNGEIEELLKILFHFRDRAKAYTHRDSKYVLGEKFELHYGRKGNIDIGGIQRNESYIFAVELVEPSPQMMVYPNVFIYHPGTYRASINLALDHGWRR